MKNRWLILILVFAIGNEMFGQEPAALPKLPDAQLDKMLAPIALYPDPLLAQIFPAASKPADVVMADRYVRDKKDVSQIDAQPWDASVKALARYPEVLTMMSEKLDWTTQLGLAFANQSDDVMNSVQRLRKQAQEAGNLKTSAQQTVVVEQEAIRIVPAEPQVIYVPQYNPEVVYVAPPPPTAGQVLAPLITFGAGMAMGAWLANDCDWHSHGVVVWGGGHYWGGSTYVHNDVHVHNDVNVHNNVNVNRNVNVNQNANINRNANVNRNANLNQNVNRGWDSGNRSTAAASTRSSAFSSNGGRTQAWSSSSRGAVSRGGGGRRR